MTAATLAPSAYPPPVEELLPQAIELAKNLGKVPSRNQIMKHFKIGAPKATWLKEELEKLAAQDQEHEQLWHYRLKQGRNVLPPLLMLRADPVAELVKKAESEATEATEPPAELAEVLPLLSPVGHPDTENETTLAHVVTGDVPAVRSPVTWPVLILCLPAFVAIWAGWVEMGRRTGFGKVTLLPGIADHFQLDTAITLPIGVETYAAYALYVWLSGRVNETARRFARASAISSLVLGGLGQITYHLMASAGWDTAPWPITALVACIPVAVLGMGAALAHLMHADQH